MLILKFTTILILLSNSEVISGKPQPVLEESAVFNSTNVPGEESQRKISYELTTSRLPWSLLKIGAWYNIIKAGALLSPEEFQAVKAKVKDLEHQYDIQSQTRIKINGTKKDQTIKELKLRPIPEPEDDSWEKFVNDWGKQPEVPRVEKQVAKFKIKTKKPRKLSDEKTEEAGKRNETETDTEDKRQERNDIIEMVDKDDIVLQPPKPIGPVGGIGGIVILLPFLLANLATSAFSLTSKGIAPSELLEKGQFSRIPGVDKKNSSERIILQRRKPRTGLEPRFPVHHVQQSIKIKTLEDVEHFMGTIQSSSAFKRILTSIALGSFWLSLAVGLDLLGFSMVSLLGIVLVVSTVFYVANAERVSQANRWRELGALSTQEQVALNSLQAGLDKYA